MPGTVRLCALQQEAVAVVVGLPLLPSGDRGEQAVKVETFVADVVSQLGLPVVTCGGAGGRLNISFGVL